MRIDELHKFNDGTLNDVRNALDDRLKGIRMQYLPQTIWRKAWKGSLDEDYMRENSECCKGPYESLYAAPIIKSFYTGYEIQSSFASITLNDQGFTVDRNIDDFLVTENFGMILRQPVHTDDNVKNIEFNRHEINFERHDKRLSLIADYFQWLASYFSIDKNGRPRIKGTSSSSASPSEVSILLAFEDVLLCHFWEYSAISWMAIFASVAVLVRMAPLESRIY
nr:hypothetical protein [Tanacetum cinerariifolium]